MNKNSCCYECPRHTGRCRETCRTAQAEAQRNADERKQKILAALAEYNSNRGTDGQIQYGRNR